MEGFIVLLPLRSLYFTGIARYHVLDTAYILRWTLIGGSSMSLGASTEHSRLPVRACVVCLLLSLLAFPPSIFAEAITWNNGANNESYSDPGNWTCGGCNTYPNNGNGINFEAIINSGGPDNVTLDANSIVNSMVLGGSGPTVTSTLN